MAHHRPSLTLKGFPESEIELKDGVVIIKPGSNSTAQQIAQSITSDMELEEATVFQHSEASETWASLQEVHQTLVFQIMEGRLALMQEDHKNRIKIIFNSLDVDGDQTLTANDFKDDLPQTHEYKQKLWDSLRSSFDINEDGCIELAEFTAVFVIKALMQDGPPISSANIGSQVLAVMTAFLPSLEYWIRYYENLLGVTSDSEI